MKDTLVSRTKDAVVLERAVVVEAMDLLRQVATERATPTTPSEAKSSLLRLAASVARSDEELRMFPEVAAGHEAPPRQVVSIQQGVAAGGRQLVGRVLAAPREDS